MSPEPRPEAIPFDPGSAELPPPLGTALTAPDTQILLIVAPDSGDPAVRTAIGLAEAATDTVDRVVLVDAAFGDARLHKRLDVPNLEGVGDIFEFGASLGRVVTRPDTRAFEFVPTGPYVPDPEAILRSDRWETVVHELETEAGILLVFVPAGTPGLDALSRRVGRAVLVGDAMSADRSASALDPSCEVVAVLEPAGPMAPARLAAAAGDAGEVDATIFDDPKLTEPVIFRGGTVEEGTSTRLWVLVALSVLLGGYFAYTTFFSEPASPPPMVAETTAPAAPQPEPRPVETPLEFSVAVEAHQDLTMAQDRAERLRASAPNVQFFIAPVPISGAVWYRVLAGSVPDREAAMLLMRRLVDEGHKTAFDDWAVRPARYAYLLGEFNTRELAEQRVVGLRELGIPAYIIPIDYEPGDHRYRVYGGAFENEAAAEVMAQMLADARIDAPLVQRVGEPAEVDT